MSDMTVVPLSGEYDASRRDELDELLDRYGDAEALAFDLDGVVRFDSTMLRSLIRFQNARAEAGKPAAIFLRPNQDLRHFLEMAELGHAFDVREAM